MKLKFFYLKLFVLLSFFACQSKPEEVILGKWEIDKEAMQSILSNELIELEKNNRSKMQDIEESIKVQIEKIAISCVFKEDGTMTMLSQGKESKGKWLITEEGKKLQAIDEDKQKMEVDIEELSRTKMILKIPLNKENTTTLVFKKVE